ncbi:DUF6265 family protein [Kangiella sp. HZ709]|uniref:DUF6265 family protein n=1 Tax=Kangiella sp. HZ709 TaxID=2666328 RepID=UPI0012B024EA|nr:DUF6265 family protein [Kangiella sp. HZ709]MRX27834.1 polysaccharide deacetylase family protein [Kangiella sp. HZ709]
MIKHLIFACCGLLIAMTAFSSSAETKKQIAITFDDAPRASTFQKANERTKLLIKNLKKVNAPAAMFFATGKHLTADNAKNLELYAKAGHFIANHSNKHLWYRNTNTEDYQRDFLNAHDKLKNFPNFKPFFRYPYLDEGRTEAKVNAMSRFLADHNYTNGYVTIDNYDWYLDSLFQKAKLADKTIDEDALKKFYVSTLVDASEFFNDIALEYLGYSPKHVLLLHDNDLAAYYIDDLILALREKGWDIISPIDAYSDPIARKIPSTLFTGQGRVAALARDNGAQPNLLVHYAEDEAYLLQQFETLVAANKQCQIEQLGFLKGQWEYRSNKNIFSEHWTISKDGLQALGKVINLQTGKTLSKETIKLTRRNNQVIYSALPQQNPKVTHFSLASCHNNRYAFINKEHDFPQLIVYQYQAPESGKRERLKVDVHNLNGKGFTLNYRRLNDRR